MRPDSNVRAFILGIARNILYEHLRKQRRTDGRIDFTSMSFAEIGPSPTTRLAAERQSQLLLQTLRQIPIESQTILELYYWEELKAREVALALDMPEGTVRTKLRKAKKLLVRALSRSRASPQVVEDTINDLDAWAKRLRGQLEQPAS